MIQISSVNGEEKRRPLMPTEYIPKSLALDIIARLCTDYSAAYAEISALRGITIEWSYTNEVS